MESQLLEKKNAEVTINTSTSSSSNQFVSDNLELPDDTFRMSLDNFSVIGENVTIGREASVDSNAVAGNSETPTVELQTPLQTPDTNTPEFQATDGNTPEIQATDGNTPEIQASDGNTPEIQSTDGNTPEIQGSDGITPEIQGSDGITPEIQGSDGITPEIQGSDGITPEIQGSDGITPEIQASEGDTPPPNTPGDLNSPPIVVTPKSAESNSEIRRPQTLLQLSLSKKNDNDVFVKPSPVPELMSPAKQLQFEVEASSATPTMKRAAIDFDFFCKNKFEQYFVDTEPKIETESDDAVDGSTFKETPVIVKADTVRHEIGFGK